MACQLEHKILSSTQIEFKSACLYQLWYHATPAAREQVPTGAPMLHSRG